MASFDGMPIVGDEVRPASGGVFPLGGESPITETKEMADGWTVEVRHGKKCVLARGGVQASYESARDEAFSAAQRGLDLLSLSGLADLRIVGAEDAHISWWVEKGDVYLRVFSVATMTATVPPVSVTVTDKDGNVVPRAPAPQLLWHDSFRYFRLSQLTDDLFDAFRNLYLALESVLSTVAPPKSKAERETDWLKRALEEAAKPIDLEAFMLPGECDLGLALLDHRNAVFHAKNSRRRLLPHELQDRSLLLSLKRLVRLYLRLVDVHLQVRRPSSGLYAAGYRYLTRHLDEGVVIQVTDDDTPFDAAGTVANPGGGHVVALSTRSAPEPDVPFVRFFTGEVPANRLSELTRIGRIVTTNGDGDPLSAGIVEGELTLDGVNRFEAQMGLRLKNTQQPRSIYGT